MVRVLLPAKAVVNDNAGVAQLAEHQPSKLRVAGSIPVSRSIVINGVADLSLNNWAGLSLLSDRFFFTPLEITLVVVQ